MVIITVTGLEASTNTDVLQATRLQTVPDNGILLVEMLAGDNDATNFFTSTLQLPSGDVPFSGMRVPSGGVTANLVGMMDSRLAYRGSFGIQQGGHAVLDFTETATAVVFWRVTFRSFN